MCCSVGLFARVIWQRKNKELRVQEKKNRENFSVGKAEARGVCWFFIVLTFFVKKTKTNFLK